MARFREVQALRGELVEAKVQLADRKAIEEAKGLLMAKKGVTEEQAYQLLRNAAMGRNNRIGDVAKLLLSLEDVL